MNENYYVLLNNKIRMKNSNWLWQIFFVPAHQSEGNLCLWVQQSGRSLHLRTTTAAVIKAQ